MRKNRSTFIFLSNFLVKLSTSGKTMKASYRSFVESAEADANSKDRQALNIKAEAIKKRYVLIRKKAMRLPLSCNLTFL